MRCDGRIGTATALATICSRSPLNEAGAELAQRGEPPDPPITSSDLKMARLRRRRRARQHRLHALSDVALSDNREPARLAGKINGAPTPTLVAHGPKGAQSMSPRGRGGRLAQCPGDKEDGGNGTLPTLRTGIEEGVERGDATKDAAYAVERKRRANCPPKPGYAPAADLVPEPLAKLDDPPRSFWLTKRALMRPRRPVDRPDWPEKIEARHGFSQNSGSRG
jgi:hypothetical protein